MVNGYRINRLYRTALLLLVMGFSGCAFSEGSPWGMANFELRTGFSAPDRNKSGDRVRTAHDYEIEVKRVEVYVGSMTLLLAKEEGGAEGFDPAKPPEGYSLCHNGHCHASDGKLVPYAKVAAQLGVQGGDWEVVGVADQRVILDLKGKLQRETWGDVVNGFVCADKYCDLPDATPTAAKLHLSSVLIEGVAYDATSKGRTPATGTKFLLTTVTQPTDISLVTVAKDLPIRDDFTEVFGQLSVSASIFDDIETYDKLLKVDDGAVQESLKFTLKKK